MVQRYAIEMKNKFNLEKVIGKVFDSKRLEEPPIKYEME